MPSLRPLDGGSAVWCLEMIMMMMLVGDGYVLII